MASKPLEISQQQPIVLNDSPLPKKPPRPWLLSACAALCIVNSVTIVWLATSKSKASVSVGEGQTLRVAGLEIVRDGEVCADFVATDTGSRLRLKAKGGNIGMSADENLALLSVSNPLNQHMAMVALSDSLVLVGSKFEDGWNRDPVEGFLWKYSDSWVGLNVGDGTNRVAVTPKAVTASGKGSTAVVIPGEIALMDGNEQVRMHLACSDESTGLSMNAPGGKECLQLSLKGSDGALRMGRNGTEKPEIGMLSSDNLQIITVNDNSGEPAVVMGIVNGERVLQTINE
ncbi:MAG: hypothetical protein R3C01_15205 [Planctomycetaceae bacterium]